MGREVGDGSAVDVGTAMEEGVAAGSGASEAVGLGPGSGVGVDLSPGMAEGSAVGRAATFEGVGEAVGGGVEIVAGASRVARGEQATASTNNGATRINPKARAPIFNESPKRGMHSPACKRHIALWMPLQARGLQ